MFKKKQSGFTITELLVVMFILVSISSLMLINYRTGQKKYALSQTVQRLVSDLRKAQNMSISGVGLAGQYCGYGVSINGNLDYYVIYGDSIAPCGTNNRRTGSDDDIETIYYPPQIKVKGIMPAPPGRVDVFFQSPNATTYLNGNDSVGISKTIVLQIKGQPSLTRSILVTTAGLIQVD